MTADIKIVQAAIKAKKELIYIIKRLGKTSLFYIHKIVILRLILFFKSMI